MRIRGIEGYWCRWGHCREDAAGDEVVWVGEAVGGASQDLEQVVGTLDSAVGGMAGVVDTRILSDQAMMAPSMSWNSGRSSVS